jgi:hypothetical protein
MSIARVLVIRFRETPKYSLCNDEDEKVVKTLTHIAEKYNRPCSITLEQLQSYGKINRSKGRKCEWLFEVKRHYKGLFATKRMSTSMTLIWLSWSVIGLAYPLFYIFLPDYITSRGASFEENSPYRTWRNYATTNSLAIPGPIIAAFLCRLRPFGRKYTMLIGALLASMD